uniref:Uncharacterized protein n=1 Tax=Triticum urartu TaxID=4572 RepID=A0A8R7UCY4_TRIUA
MIHHRTATSSPSCSGACSWASSRPACVSCSVASPSWLPRRAAWPCGHCRFVPSR